MEKAALYARVSSEEQVEGYSIDAQRRAFKALCDAKGWLPQNEFIDEGKSAHSDNIDNRPAFRKMINDALAGKFDILVVHKLDRFSRHLRTTLEYFDKLQKAGVSFVSISEQMDFTTPIGKVQLALLGAFAQYYSDNLSQETKKGWAERKAQGFYCGLLPFGAMKGEDGVPIPHPDTCPGLLMVFELAAEGKTDREIAAILNTNGYRTAGNQGNRPFSKGTVGGILTNRFYLGKLPNNGSWISGKHEPFIDKKLFQVVQDTRVRRTRIRRTINNRARTYSLSTLMWCNRCDSKMRIQMSINGRPRIYCSGRSEGLGCKNSGTFLDVYENQIQWYLEHFMIPDDYQSKIVEAHKQLNSTNSISKQKGSLQRQLDRIKELYQWGHLTTAQYKADFNRIQNRLLEIQCSGHDNGVLKKLAKFLANVSDAWQEASQEQRNRLAGSLFEQIRVEGGRVVLVKPRAELEPFFKLNHECHTRDIGSDPEGI